jgi:predicted Rossmann fold flavoprotein
MNYDVIVLGAGAAGLFCAARAGQRGLRVIAIDHAEHLGEKIRISGGGRCNFTNLRTGPECFISANPDFCRSALARFTPEHFLRLLESHRIAWHEKTLGQLFCDHSATQIIEMLLAECERGRVAIRHPLSVVSVGRNDSFFVQTTGGRFTAPRLVIATGGLSIPAIGATGLGYEIAKQFGLAVVPPSPGLVPLALDAPDLERFAPLAGVSFDAAATIGDGPPAAPVFREAALLTHRGLSGPAVLQISSYWRPGTTIEFDLLPEIDAEAWLAERRADPKCARSDLAPSLSLYSPKPLPERFARAWAATCAPPKPLAQWTRGELAHVARQLKAWRLRPSGTLGYKKAEVTLGGVDTRALSQKSMQATSVPGLAFIGEVVDVTGWLGGYNFQWAWASAAACADHL